MEWWEDPDRYEDTGCELWHACLSCPFPVCGEEYPGGIPALKRRLTYQVVAWLLADGHSAAEVAQIMGMSRRHVLRIKAALRRQPDLWATAPWTVHPPRRRAGGAQRHEPA